MGRGFKGGALRGRGFLKGRGSMGEAEWAGLKGVGLNGVGL